METRTLCVLVIVLVGVLFAAKVEGADRKDSQKSDYHFLQTNWSTENGLPGNDVTSIVQTQDRYLWVGTFGGLARFDGVRFRIFNSGNTPGLISNRITTLYEDRAGALWIGAENGEICRYFQGEFKNIAIPFSNSEIQTIFQDRAGKLWIGTAKDGLIALNQAEPDKSDHFSESHTIPSKNVKSICDDRDGTLWIGTLGGLVKYRDGSFSVAPPPAGRRDWQIVSLKPHPESGLFLVTQLEFGHYTEARGFVPYLPAWPHAGYAGVMSVGKSGDVWYAGAPTRVTHVQANGEISHARPDVDAVYMIRALLADAEGNLWISSNGGGLVQLREPRVEMITKANGLLLDTGAGPIVEDHQGDVWFSTGSGLNCFCGGVLRQLDEGEARTSRQWRSWMVTALYVARNGDLWVAKPKKLIRQRGEQATTFPVELGNGLVYVIYEDRQNHMWLGAEDGLAEFRNGALTVFTRKDGLVHNNIQVLLESHDGALWIGTVGGLSRFKDGVFTNYSTLNGLSGNHVRDLYEDREGVLWIGTYGGGLNRLFNGRISQITAKNGLFDDFISRILVDEHENFWMLGNRGIFRVNRWELNGFIYGQGKTLFGSSYGRADGMAVTEGNGGRFPSGWRMRDGSMWFPLVKGVAILDPKRLSERPPPVVIEQALVDGESMDLRRPIEIKAENQDLEMQYTGLLLRNPEQLRFKYKLEGYDQDWVFADFRRTAFYTNLSPGRYTFRVSALSSDGVWSAVEATQEINALPPIWKTNWFRALLGLILIGSLTWALWWLNSRYQRRVARQEAFARRLIDSQEHERQRIAAELHDGLGQSLVIIGRRAMVSLEGIDDKDHLREQLKEIAEASAYALEEVREIIFDLRPQQLDRLGLTTAISDLLARVASVNHWSLTQHLDELDNLFPKEVENSLYRIVQEVVNNISKHARASNVSFEVRKETDRLEMSISDDGLGFKTSPIENSTLQGLGLHSIYERSRLLGGEASIHSVPGKGTTVRLVLPLKR
jgi:signal transduction histidine kinase/ligand-binding sensor domain-containing protein